MYVYTPKVRDLIHMEWNISKSTHNKIIALLSADQDRNTKPEDNDAPTGGARLGMEIAIPPQPKKQT
ncbi:hypothetical protein F5Y04DRAFT_275689 [Hypomontagnella monticulosa]|nr:hypothetical protein F5Y04DRAFT_275689 [Hypomontagnella monticulosa]